MLHIVAVQQHATMSLLLLHPCCTCCKHSIKRESIRLMFCWNSCCVVRFTLLFPVANCGICPFCNSSACCISLYKNFLKKSSSILLLLLIFYLFYLVFGVLKVAYEAGSLMQTRSFSGWTRSFDGLSRRFYGWIRSYCGWTRSFLVSCRSGFFPWVSGTRSFCG